MKVAFYTDEAGESRWTLTADNHEPIGASTEGYRDRDDCEANFRQVTGTVPGGSDVMLRVSATLPVVRGLASVDPAAIETIEVEHQP